MAMTCPKCGKKGVILYKCDKCGNVSCIKCNRGTSICQICRKGKMTRIK